MLHKYKISICAPAYRTHLWNQLYDSADEACGGYTWELILVGPNDPPEDLRDKPNFKFFRDYGSPSRCAQIATSLAEGEFMMFAADDGYFMKDSIEECLDMFDENSSQNDIVIARLTEGKDHGGGWFEDSYWKAWTHPDLRLPGIDKEFYITLLSICRLDYYRYLGGLECAFEHINLNLHDFAFRAQHDGATIEFSPSLVMNCDWSYLHEDHQPVQQAYQENDRSLLAHLYSQPCPERITIDYFNWIFSDSVWKRRFGDKK